MPRRRCRKGSEAVLPERLVREGLERGVLVEVLRRAKPVEVAFKVALRKRRTPKFIIEQYLKFLLQPEGPSK
jgi:hypothetical protein